MRKFSKTWLRCRTTKLLSQKRHHLAAFCISFYWQRGTRPEKRRDYYLKKSPSSGILHQLHCKRMLWLRPNWYLWKFRVELPNNLFGIHLRLIFDTFFILNSLGHFLRPGLRKRLWVLQLFAHSHKTNQRRQTKTKDFSPYPASGMMKAN